MIALKSHSFMTLAILFAVATGCCQSTPNVPLNRVQKPLQTFASEPGSQRTYSAPGGNYLTPVARKVQPPIYANNLKSSSLNAAKNFNSQPLKDELVNKNINNTPTNKDNPAFAGNKNTVPRESSVIPHSSVTSAGSIVAQTQPAKQSTSSVDELLKQINVAGPVQTGASNVNINNNVSNIKVGNSKNSNINYGFPALHRERLLGNQNDARKLAFNDVAARYIDNSQTYGSGFDPKQRPVVYENQVSPGYLFAEDDYFANNNGGYNNGNPDYGAFNKQDLVSRPEKPKKCDKKNQKPTTEQVELKNQLLDLAAKATSALPADNSPLLKFNKETGTLEQVQADPNVQLYKDKLQEALRVLNPKKLSSKKLKKVLYGESDENQFNQPGAKQAELKSSYGAQPSNGYYNVPEMALLQQPSNNQQSISLPKLSNYGNDEDQRQNYYSQLPTDQYAQSAPLPSYARATDYPAQNEQQIDISALDEEQKRSLVDQVRAVLNDNINRFNEVVAFSDEFLEQLLHVGDDELTPNESSFKHMILCNADERYCQRTEVYQGLQQYGESPPEASEYYATDTGYDGGQEEAQQWSQPAGGANDNYGASNYYEQPEEVVDQVEADQNHYSGEPSEQQLEDELAKRKGLNEGDGRRFSRQSSSDSYLYSHSAGGARNGVPLTPQRHEYAEQSSFSRTNQGPPTVSSRSSLVVGTKDGRFTSPQLQLQQPVGRSSDFASQQSAVLNGSSNKGNQVRQDRPLPSGSYSARQPGEQVLPVKRPIGLEKPQTVPNSFQQLGGQQMKQQFSQQPARVQAPNGLSNAVAGRANLNANSGGSVLSNGGRILKLQQQQQQQPTKRT